MPSYWRVAPKFWVDPDMRRASDDARLLALYLLTCEHRNVIGLFRLPRAYVSDDLQWLPERLPKPFGELLEMGFLAYDEEAQVLLLTNALKYQSPENDNQVTASLRQLEDLPDTFLTSDFKRLAQRFCERLAQRLPKGFGEGFGKPTTTTTATATARNHVVDVFDAWVASFPQPTRRDLTEARRHAITAALERYPLEDVLAAVQGWRHDPWEDRPQHNDLPQLLHMGSKRKPANVLEKMRDLWRDGPPAITGRRTAQALSFAQQMANHHPGEEGRPDDLGGMDRRRDLAQRQLP